MGRVISDLPSFSETVANGDLLVCHNVSKAVNTRDEKLTVEKLLTDALGNRSVTITSGGNVGIGAAALASDRLAVVQGGSTETGVVVGNGVAVSVFNSGATILGLRDTGSDIECALGTSAASSAAFVGSMTGHAFQLRTNNASRVSISNTGQVLVSSLVGSGTAAVEATNTGVLQRAASDERMKTDVEPIGAGDALAIVDALRPVRYRWNEKYAPMRGEQVEVGLIAQEVQAHVPELVGANGDGMLSVDYARLTALLIGAVQALTARVEALEAAAA